MSYELSSRRMYGIGQAIDLSESDLRLIVEALLAHPSGGGATLLADRLIPLLPEEDA